MSVNMEYLVVAGGGQGSYGYAGGGGAGGMITSSATINPSGYSVNIEVGAGGSGQPTDASSSGTNGSNSVFGSSTAIGGGGGSRFNPDSSSVQAKDGGSGGGGGPQRSDQTNYLQHIVGGQGTAGQGNNGGDGNVTTQFSNYDPEYRSGGGGGGAGSAGTTPLQTDSAAGEGGAPKQWPVDLQYYAAGGGGSNRVETPATPADHQGGSGGGYTDSNGNFVMLGGHGAPATVGGTSYNGTSGVANTGSGGGAGWDAAGPEATGADGVVKLWVPISYTYSSSHITNVTNNISGVSSALTYNGTNGTLVTFTGAGTATWTPVWPETTQPSVNYQTKVQQNAIGQNVWAVYNTTDSVWYNQPVLSLVSPNRYTFDVSESSNNGYVLSFGTIADTTDTTIESTYVTRSGTPGTANASVTLDLTNYSGDALLYFEASSAGMGYYPAIAEPSRTVITVNAEGDAHVDTSIKKIGTGSCSLDGDIDYLRIDSAYNQYFSLTGDFTVELWAYKNTHTNINNSSGSEQKQLLVSNWGPGNNAFYLSFFSSTQLAVYLNSDFTTGVTNSLTVNYTASLNTWTHYAVVRSGTTITIYANGSSLGNYTYSGAINLQEDWAFGANAVPSDPKQFFKGQLDEIRISDTARYTSNFTPTTTAFTNDSNTLLLLHCDGTDGSTTFLDDAVDIGGSASVYTIEVAGNNYWITLPNTSEPIESPQITFAANETYVFDQSDPTNYGEQIVFGYTNDDRVNILTSADGVFIMGTPGQSGAYTRLSLSNSFVGPLYYYSKTPPIDISYVVTVENGSYYLNGIAKPQVEFTANTVYYFDESHSSNTGHELVFGRTEDDNVNIFGSVQGVESFGNPGEPGAFKKLILSSSFTGVIYYYCANHSNMGFVPSYNAPDSTAITNAISGSTATLTTISTDDLTDASIVGNNNTTKRNYTKQLLKKIITDNTATLSGKRLTLSGITLPGFSNPKNKDIIVVSANASNSLDNTIAKSDITSKNVYVVIEENESYTFPTHDSTLTVTKTGEDTYESSFNGTITTHSAGDTIVQDGLNVTIGSLYASLDSEGVDLLFTNHLNESLFATALTVATTAPTVTFDATVSCTGPTASVLSETFYFKTDSDIATTSTDDIHYFVDTSKWATIIADLNATTNGTISLADGGFVNGETISESFLRHLATIFFGTHLAVDIFNNETVVRDDLDSQCLTVATNISTTITSIGLTGTDADLLGSSGSYYFDDNVTGTKNVTREIMQQLMNNAMPRFEGSNLANYAVDAVNQPGVYKMPFVAGDTLSYVVTMIPNGNQDTLVPLGTTTPRKFKVKMQLQ